MTYKESEKQVTELLSDYLHNEKVIEMGSYIQHGHVTTLEHCLRVAVISYIIVRLLGLKVNLMVMLVGALLHDFYLYDWHEGSAEVHHLTDMHGFTHPGRACANARKYFDLDDATISVIETHMFPLTITKVPKSREALIVSVADKIAAAKETVDRKSEKYKQGSEK